MSGGSGMVELTAARKRLSEALGDDSKLYFQYLRKWFSKTCTKEEFDQQARRLMTPETVHLHNQFFLAILTKCQSLVNLVTTPIKQEIRLPEGGDSKDASGERLKKGKIKKKSKSNKSSLDQRFQSFPACEMAPEVPDSKIHAEERKILFCVLEGTLPDIGLIHGRLLVSAWEEGIEGCEDEAVSLIMVAVQHFLKNIITSLLVSRNPFRTREGAQHSIGCPLPNPWLQSTQTRRKYLANSSAATESTLLNETGLVPISRPEADKAEAEAVFEAALGIKRLPKVREPISLFDLLRVLQMDKSVVPNHTVYSLNMERIIMRLN